MKNHEVEKNTIFLGITGSHCYGLNTPESDRDESGICIKPLDYYFGCKKFEQADKWTDENGNKIDKTIYSIDKAVRLMLDNNPNMLNLLYLPERCIIQNSEYWQVFLDNRDDFLSKQIRWKFSGYAHAQLSRISTHRSYLNNPIPKPNRKDFDLPEKSIFPETQVENIAKLSERYITEEFKSDFFSDLNHINDYYVHNLLQKYIPDRVALKNALEEYKLGQTSFLRVFESISSNFLAEEYRGQAHNELRYITAYKNWQRYEDWKKGRNPKRAAIEAKCGFDGKHASQLIMLQRQAIEMLAGKGLLLDRTNIDREYLMAIRAGNVQFDEILKESEANNLEMEKLFETTTLPANPKINKIEQLKMEVIEKYLWKEKK